MAPDKAVETEQTWVDGLRFVGSASRLGVGMMLEGAEPGGARARVSSSSELPMEALLTSLAGYMGEGGPADS